MPSIVSIASFAGLAALSFANPIEKRDSKFRINQIAVPAKYKKSGAVAYQKAFQKYNKNVPASVAAAAAQSGSVAATPTSGDEEYLCPVTVGSQTLNLDFDTGSADLWVFSNLLPSSQQSGHDIYKTSSSKKQSGESWRISYGDGSGASGTVYTDKVVIGSVTATSQAVEAATSVSSAFVQDTNDGLVGLAFSSINTVSPNPATTFFDTVKSSLSQKLFAADLRHAATGAYDFGFIDTSAYQGDLVYTDVDSSQGFWSFTADGYSIGGSSGSGSLTGIADTGTTLMLLDDSVVSAYYSQIDGAENSSSDGGYVFPCDSSLPDFVLDVGGQSVTVSGQYINFATASGGNCFGGIQSNSGIGFSIFGDIFFKSQYVVFDMTTGSPRLGFGQQ